MAIAPRLDLRTTQTLVMTPQMQQAISLLQMSNLELNDFVAEEIERNPLLEREDDVLSRIDGEKHDDTLVKTDATVTEQQSTDTKLLDSHDGEDANGNEAALDMDMDNDFNDSITDAVDPGAAEESFYQHQNLGDWSGSGGHAGAELPGIEQTLSESAGLREHIMGQIGVSFVGKAEKLVAVYMADMLDASGYFVGTVAEVAENLGCGEAQVERVLEKLQTLEPAGIFARSLGECLSLQLEDRERLTETHTKLLDNLEMLARRDIAGLCRICGVGEKALARLIGEIRTLNPKPAADFGAAITQAVTPDVFVHPKQNGGYTVELNNATLPRVLVNNAYYDEVANIAVAGKEKRFINEQMSAANWLVKALHQRATTVLAVSREIVRHQRAFFDHGVVHLKPLVLREIAQEVERDESTVSRVTNNKFMSTPRGIFELKYFFSQGVSGGTDGEGVAAAAVKHHIKTLTDNEEVNKILSDDKLVTLLKAQGIDIARRTVAKYREAMGIPSSVQRRRNKKAGL